jgi:hypothetical protein
LSWLKVVRACAFLAQQAPAHEHIERAEQRVLGNVHHGEQAFEIEPPAEHGRNVEHRARFGGHVLQPRTHRRTQRFGQRQPARGVRGDLAFAQRVQHRREEERVAVRFALQSRGELRAAVASKQLPGFGEREPRECDVARVRLAPQARDEIREARAAVEILVPVSVQREDRQARGLAAEIVEELRARIVGPLQVVYDDEQLTGLCRQHEKLHDRTEQAGLARFGQVRREHRHRGALCDLGRRAPRSRRSTPAATSAARRAAPARAPA